jgi:hypothetical protein
MRKLFLISFEVRFDPDRRSRYHIGSIALLP